VQLVVVLGHSKCGAIQATINSLQQPSADHSPSLQFIVDQIKPSVESLKEAGVDEKNADLLQQAIRTNVQTSMSHLSQDSQVLKELVTNKGLRIVGAEYSLDTGVVEFFDADL